jgi:hypothetical protein
MIRTSGANTEMSRTAPYPVFAVDMAKGIQRGYPFPVSTAQYQGKIRPRMIVRIPRITFEEFVYKDVERKSNTIFQKQIISFKIWFLIFPIQDHTVTSKMLEDFFKHIKILAHEKIRIKSHW